MTRKRPSLGRLSRLWFSPVPGAWFGRLSPWDPHTRGTHPVRTNHLVEPNSNSHCPLDITGRRGRAVAATIAGSARLCAGFSL